MENLKKFTLIVALSLLGTCMMAQSQQALQTAFTKSYELEQSGKYIAAVNELKPVYKTDGYFINIRMGWLY